MSQLIINKAIKSTNCQELPYLGYYIIDRSIELKICNKNHYQAYLWLLSKARFIDFTPLVKQKVHFVLAKDEFFITQKFLQLQFNWTRKKVEVFLQKLVDLEIAVLRVIKKGAKSIGTVIKFCQNREQYKADSKAKKKELGRNHRYRKECNNKKHTKKVVSFSFSLDFKFSKLSRRLIKFGFSNQEIEKIYSSFENKLVYNQIKLLDLGIRSKKIKNPVAWLKSALKNNFNLSKLIELREERKQTLTQKFLKEIQQKTILRREEKRKEEENLLYEIKQKKIDKWIEEHGIEYQKIIEETRILAMFRGQFIEIEGDGIKSKTLKGMVRGKVQKLIEDESSKSLNIVEKTRCVVSELTNNFKPNNQLTKLSSLIGLPHFVGSVKSLKS
jgi:hypothetical protein